MFALKLKSNLEIVNSSFLISVGQFISDKANYLIYVGHCWLLSSKASFYKLSKKDETKYATATSAATNLSFQYNMSLYQFAIWAGNFTLNHKRSVTVEQGRSKICSRILRETYLCNRRAVYLKVNCYRLFHYSHSAIALRSNLTLLIA